MGLVTPLALGLLLIMQTSITNLDDPSSALSPPMVDDKPVEVRVGFYALDFARITARDESFDMTGYLELSWRDPRLARTFSGKDRTPPSRPRRAGVRHVNAASIWTPRYFFENALEQPRFHVDPVAEVDPDGLVTTWAVVSGKFSSPMDLRRFPFDRQTLQVRIGSFEDESTVRFEVNPRLVVVHEEAFLTDWTLDKATARVEPHRYESGEESFPRFIYQVGVHRQPTFYFWRVMLPLTLLALVAWASFWFEPIGLQPQISTCMTALVALIAFDFAIDFSLPKVTYLTLIDKHALIGFCFVAASVAMVTLIHVNVKHNRLEVALRIQRIARWTFLPVYVFAVALNLGLLGR